MKSLAPAELILDSLGITDPKEIDLEAIAWEMGAIIKCRPLDNCEARIIGNGDKAIITVNSRSRPRRQRFSIAHELGHWRHHRHRLLMCQASDIGIASKAAVSERTADIFARDLLMPGFLFQPVARTHNKLNFQMIRTIADIFNTSLTATAIRIVEAKLFNAMLICHQTSGRKWFTRSPDVPEHWFPSEQLSSDSFAFDVLFGTKPEDIFPRKIGADAWFEKGGADRFEIQEQSVRTIEGEILTLLLITDDEMLE